MAFTRLLPDETRRPSAGRVLALASLLPALAVAGWLLAGLPLLLAGMLRPWFTVLAAVPVIVLLCAAGLRRLPEVVEATGRQVAAVLAIAVGSGVFNAVFHSEQLIVRRDPATYAQYAIWLAGHGSLPIPRQDAAFGGPDPMLQFDSVGFYDYGGAVVPQFMPGPPMLYAAADWLGGLLLGPPVLGALAVLTVGGVTARLAGGRWAPVAALTFAVSLPILYTSRTTFSEIPSLILLFGGLALVHDAITRARAHRAPTPAGPHTGAPPAAALAGLVFGLATLVRIDGLRDVLPVLAFAGLLVAMRRFRAPADPARPADRGGPAVSGGGGRGRVEGVLGVPLLAGLVAGGGLGFLAAYAFARPYLSYLSRSVVPLLAICAVVLVLTVVGTALAPRLARLRLPRRAPEVGAALVVLVMAGFAVRPWVQTVRREPVTLEDARTARFIMETQKANGLPIDGTRLYFEESLYWVIWYVGVPVVMLATVGAAVLVRRLLRNGAAFAWLLPLAVIGWTTVTTLLRPEITPDQPWASRRLVPVVIPGLIVLAVWGLGWVRDRARRFGYGRRVQGWLAGAGTILILVPPVITSIGTAFTPIERGERAAVEAMCAAIPPGASVLMAERVTGDRFTQVVRGMCGVPVAQVRRAENVDTAPEPEVERLIARIRTTGRTPVVLAATADQVQPYGRSQQVMSLVTRQDERSLTEPPNGTWSLRINVWMSRP
ncbi:hypothetical protein [Nonomuraea typhae]|uniref:hypothetical protein n=1 Tax=Nonomuraea typhae TaxID=2603600 RepID=UPI0012FBED60|nr:hypothetical protein [Nonomuraea typhae]